MAEFHIKNTELRESGGKGFGAVCKNLFPNRSDNLKQGAIKLVFIAVIAIMLFSAVFLSVYFRSTANQNRILEKSRILWQDTRKTLPERIKLMKKSNGDFIGWLKIGGTDINTPVFQSENDSFYQKHNQQKKKSAHGALYIPYIDTVDAEGSDKNITVFGNNMSDGTMFGTLKRYKNLNFYKQNPNISFTTAYGDSIYKVFSVLILNSSIWDDNNYVYNAFQDEFENGLEFDKWLGEARARSIIDTKLDVNSDDSFLTLVTQSDEFENANLVIMARKTREGESTLTDTRSAIANAAPKYPKRWYDENSVKYPYQKEKENIKNASEH